MSDLGLILHHLAPNQHPTTNRGTAASDAIGGGPNAKIGGRLNVRTEVGAAIGEGGVVTGALVLFSFRDQESERKELGLTWRMSPAPDIRPNSNRLEPGSPTLNADNVNASWLPVAYLQRKMNDFHETLDTGREPIFMGTFAWDVGERLGSGRALSAVRKITRHMSRFTAENFQVRTLESQLRCSSAPQCGHMVPLHPSPLVPPAHFGGLEGSFTGRRSCRCFF